MDIRFEQRVNIKFCAKLGKTATSPVLPWSLSVRFFSVSTTEKKAKRTAEWEYRGYSSGCEDGAHRHSERGIHQLVSGLAETLATVYWPRRELLRRGQEALVVRLNFVSFTDSVSERYGQRMYFHSQFTRFNINQFIFFKVQFSYWMTTSKIRFYFHHIKRLRWA
jgi:hypothetical protein